MATKKKADATEAYKALRRRWSQTPRGTWRELELLAEFSNSNCLDDLRTRCELAGLDSTPVQQMRVGLVRGHAIATSRAAEFARLVQDVDRLVDRLEARERMQAPAPSAKVAAPAALDVQHDPGCQAIRDLLRTGPRKLGEIATDRRCRIARRRVSELLAAMKAAGQVTQTSAKGPWRLLVE